MPAMANEASGGEEDAAALFFVTGTTAGGRTEARTSGNTSRKVALMGL